MVNLTLQKRLAASVKKCGRKRIWIDSAEIADVANVKTSLLFCFDLFFVVENRMRFRIVFFTFNLPKCVISTNFVSVIVSKKHKIFSFWNNLQKMKIRLLILKREILPLLHETNPLLSITSFHDQILWLNYSLHHQFRGWNQKAH